MNAFGVLKISVLLSVLIVLFSCNNDELENKIADLEKDKLEVNSDLRGKEEEIIEYIASLNEIQENLNMIKERENIITTRFDNGDKEIDNNMKDQIVDDIGIINKFLQDNKDKMAAINSKLKKSNLKINELQKMIENLTIQMQNKDAEISSLKGQLAEANKQLAVLFQEYNNRLEELGDKEDKLNTAYYCYGSSKELKEQGVITKEGGFIGIGKTEKLSDNFNKQYFTKIDIKLVNEIDLMSNKVKIITNHPTDSYKIEGEDGKADKLVILNSEAFWSASKYLVMVVE